MQNTAGSPVDSPAPNEGPRGLFTRLLDLLSSIWFGVGLLVVIFLYSSIGSAVPPIRQGALADWFGWEALRFEMTEMEWFSSRFFLVLIGLFCVSDSGDGSAHSVHAAAFRGG